MTAVGEAEAGDVLFLLVLFLQILLVKIDIVVVIVNGGGGGGCCGVRVAAVQATRVL